MTRVASIRGPYQKVGKPGPKPRKPLPRVSKKKAAHRHSEEGQKGLSHMAFVHMLPCVACELDGVRQTSPTELHHPKHDRFSQEKEDDQNGIPLCMCHHQGLRFDRDRSKVAIHKEPNLWREKYGPDHGFIKQTRQAVAAICDDMLSEYF